MVANDGDDHLPGGDGCLEDAIQPSGGGHNLRLGGVPHVVGEVVAREEDVPVLVDVLLGHRVYQTLHRAEDRVTVAKAAPVSGRLTARIAAAARPTAQRLIALRVGVHLVVQVQVNVRQVEDAADVVAAF